ncbi:MAG: hypothetical protein ACRDPM_20445 [Solirubrobacteraceae bacterium]
MLKAAKSGNAQSVATAKAIHLNQVIALAVDQLDGHYKAAIRLYGVYIDHIISMADMLGTGIIQQFPARF